MRSLVISNLYYRLYMSEYYLKNKERIVKQATNYYNDNKLKVRVKQNDYYRNVYYPEHRQKMIERNPCYFLRHQKKEKKKSNKKNVTCSTITVFTPNLLIKKDSIIIEL